MSRKEHRPLYATAKLTSAESARIHAMLDEMPEDKVADALRVNRITVYRALAGRGLRRSTVECIRARLGALK